MNFFDLFPISYRNFAVAAFAVVLGVISHMPVSSAQNWDAIEIKSQAVRPNLFMLQGKGGNIGLLNGSDGAVLIDSQFAPLSEKLLIHIEQLGVTKPRFLVNTHWHRDHTDGNANFAGTGLEILAHRHVRDRLENRGSAGESSGLPALTFQEQMTLYLNEEKIDLHYVGPAHTDGDVIVHFVGLDVIHMGDTYFNGLYSFFDRSSGGSFDGLVAALNKGLQLAGPNTLIIPGHGKLSTIEELRWHRDHLVEIGERVRQAMLAGLDRSDFIAGLPTVDIEADYGGSFKVMKAEKFLALVWDDLAS